MTPAPIAPGRPATAGRLGVVLAAVCVVLDAVGVAVHLLTPAADRTGLLDTPEPVLGPALAVVAGVLTTRPAARRMGRVLLGVAAAACSYTWARAVSAAAWADGSPGPVGDVATWLATWTWVWGFLPFVLLLPLLFPTGGPPSRRWRPVVAASVALTAGVSVVLAMHPAVDSDTGARNPLGSDLLEPAYPVLQALLAVTFPVLAVLGLASLVVRARGGDPVERRQLALFGWAVLVAAVASFLLPGPLTSVATLLVPAALLVAVLRYRLYDVDVLVSRTVVAAALLGGGLLLYVGVVAWVGTAVDGDGPAALAGAAAVALAFHPARVRLQRSVDRLLFGERGDPHRVLTLVDEAVRAAGTPQEALERAVDAAATALRLPMAVEVQLPDGTRARAGSVDTVATAVDVVAHGVPVGRLAAGPRGRAERLDRTDEQRLAEVAAALAGVASALRLAHEVEVSREEAVAAREEERRRLRRDLHDGLGPQLAAVVMTVDTARGSLADADRARAVLDVAVDAAQTAVADVRRLVHGLRPPALDDLGLVAALRSTGPAAAGLAVDVAADDLGDLPAAVEVAAYRIAQEALTNVVRHAGTDRAAVALRAVDGVLALTVADDGCGIAEDRRAGVGLTSMRERAAEVGGTVTVTAQDGGGTLVAAHLPLQRSGA